MVRGDLPLLLTWLSRPHVSEWWRDEPADLAGVEAVYGACIDGEDPTELFVIEAAGRPVGMIQRYLFADEPEWTRVFAGIADVTSAAGIDYLIGEPDAVGRGLGSEVIVGFVAMVFDWRPVTSIVVSVQQDNPASWRILEKAGFARVWAGELDSPDPSDAGPEYVYRLERVRPTGGSGTRTF
jgi:aminoglycoside 6'-N-acetyltransferase